jgi:hypothetical protein
MRCTASQHNECFKRRCLKLIYLRACATFDSRVVVIVILHSAIGAELLSVPAPQRQGPTLICAQRLPHAIGGCHDPITNQEFGVHKDQ